MLNRIRSKEQTNQSLLVLGLHGLEYLDHGVVGGGNTAI